MLNKILTGLIALSALTLPAFATAKPTEIFGEPSAVEQYGDWVVGCSGPEGEKLNCTGVALIPEGNSDKQATVMRIERRRYSSADVSFPKITYPDGGYVVKVDGKTFFAGDKLRYDAPDDPIRVYNSSLDKTAYNRLFRHIARGNKLSLHDKSGKLLGTVSLKGATASMRDMDRQQKRNGYENAFFNRGEKEGNPTSRRVERLSLPAQNQLPNLEAISRILPDDSCGDGLQLGTAHEIHPFPYMISRLEDGRRKTSKTIRAIVLADCGKGEFGQMSKAYIATRNDGDETWDLEPAKYTTHFQKNDIREIPLLHAAAYETDSYSTTLISTRKYQNRDDCGIRQEFEHDPTSEQFDSYSRYDMPVCGGDTKWIEVE